MTPGRKKLLLCLVLIPLLAGAFELRIKDNMVDFSVFYQAGQRLRLGETLYREADGHYQFKYMPFSAFLFLPFSILPLGAAQAAWYAVVLISTGLVFYLTARLLRAGGPKAALTGAVAAAVLGRYFLREIELGQVNALITALLLLMILSLDSGPPGRGAPRPGGERATGPCWGLAAALKPYALVFLPYFLLRKKWLAVAGGLAVLGLAVLSPAVFYGLDGNFIVLREWWSLLSASTPGLLSTQDNVSLMGFLAKRTGDHGLQRLLYALALAGLAGLVLALVRLGRKAPRPHVLECLLLLALIPLVSPLGWDYTMLAAAPAVMLIAGHLDKFSRPARAFLYLTFAAIALSLYDIMGRTLYSRFMSWSMITVEFMILIGYVSYLRFRGHA